MKIDWLKFTVIGHLIFALTACTQSGNPNASNDVTPSTIEMTPMAPAQPPQGDSTTMTPSGPTPAVPGLENLIEKAKANLAQRLSISVNEINLMEAIPVTWPDASLGCPQEGMMYAQVLTPGYLILLERGGATFEYHASSGNTIVACENPSPPVPNDPGNT